MTALELAALAGISRALETTRSEAVRRHSEVSREPEDDQMTEDEEVLAEIATMPEDEAVAESPSISQDDTEAKPDPQAFIRDASDANARYYRAHDEQMELLVAFLSDGRLRMADTDGRRFAGMLETDKADLLEIGSHEWSRVFVSATPEGSTQLELHGGPYDTHVLICEALPG